MIPGPLRPARRLPKSVYWPLRKRWVWYVQKPMWRAAYRVRRALGIPEANPFDPQENPYAHAMFERYPDADHGVLMAAAWADLGAHMEGLTGEDVRNAIEEIHREGRQ